MNNVKSYWDKAISLDQYLEVNNQRLEQPKDEQEASYKEYYDLGAQRMARTLKTFKKDEALVEKLKSKNFNGKILIISEPWCGDASATVPAIHEFFKDTHEVKIFLRDDDTSLIDQYLTNGTQSIPIALVLNQDYEVLAHWGPRPKHGFELLKKFKENPEAYPKEEFYNDLQVYYAKNKGKDALEELLDLI